MISENYYGAYSVQLALDQLANGLCIVWFTSIDFTTHGSKFIKKVEYTIQLNCTLFYMKFIVVNFSELNWILV